MGPVMGAVAGGLSLQHLQRLSSSAQCCTSSLRPLAAAGRPFAGTPAQQAQGLPPAVPPGRQQLYAKFRRRGLLGSGSGGGSGSSSGSERGAVQVVASGPAGGMGGHGGGGGEPVSRCSAGRGGRWGRGAVCC